MNLFRLGFCLVAILTIILIVFFTYHSKLGKFNYAAIFTHKKFSAINRKTILLYYSKDWERDFIGKRWGFKYFENCPVKNCMISQNRNTYDKSDLVIFQLDLAHLPEFSLPSRKQRGQIWIFSEFEAPNNIVGYSLARYLKSNIELHKWKVNWTMGYRRDADFVIPMGRFKPLQIKNAGSGNVFKNKTKSIVWFNSHCKTNSKREEFAKKLQKYFRIDIYGLCGSKQCNTGYRFKEALDINIPGKKNDCFKILDEDYKFYLSFENSLCRDYISEKGLHHIMRHDIIPIMRSGVNHSLFNPLHSFIDVSKFESIDKLVTYIKYVEGNKAAYMDYMEWKKFFYSEGMASIYQEALCEICKRAHEPQKYYRIYNDIFEWTYLSKLGNVCQDF